MRFYFPLVALTLAALFTSTSAHAMGDSGAMSDFYTDDVVDYTGEDFSGLDLSGQDFTNDIFTDTNLEGTYLTDVILTGVVSGGITSIPAALPEDWMLEKGYLIGFGADLSGADLTDADLTDADLTDAVLTDAVLTKTVLNGADLEGADFAGADLTDVIGLCDTDNLDTVTGIDIEDYCPNY